MYIYIYIPPKKINNLNDINLCNYKSCLSDAINEYAQA